MLDNKTSFQEPYDPFDFMVLGFFPRQPSGSWTMWFFKAISTEVLQKVRLVPGHPAWEQCPKGNPDLVLAVAGKMCDSWLLFSQCLCWKTPVLCRSKKARKYFFVFANNSKKLNKGEFLTMGMNLYWTDLNSATFSQTLLWFSFFPHLE